MDRMIKRNHQWKYIKLLKSPNVNANNICVHMHIHIHIRLDVTG